MLKVIELFAGIGAKIKIEFLINAGYLKIEE